MPDDVDRLLHSQVAYYRARAGEYDEWFLRRGRYDHGAEANGRWFDEAALVRTHLDAFTPSGAVLEFACGTGLWTGELLKHTRDVTAVDAAPEALAIHTERYGDRLLRVEADIFAFEPSRLFDVVFFSFWLSHIPSERFEAFWALVDRCLRPGGRFFFIDSRRDVTSTAHDHVLPSEHEPTQERLLNDGRRFRIVKRYYEPTVLGAELSALGWDAKIDVTPTYFLWGAGRRTDVSR